MAKTAKGKVEPIAPSNQLDQPDESTRKVPTEEEIALRAYHIFLERNGVEGTPEDDWLEAERQLTVAED